MKQSMYQMLYIYLSCYEVHTNNDSTRELHKYSLPTLASKMLDETLTDRIDPLFGYVIVQRCHMGSYVHSAWLRLAR